MTDLWSEASRDIDAERRDRALEIAKAASQGTWEFLALAQSPQEYGDRVALAADQITATASANGVEVADLVGVFDQRFALLMEAKGNPFGDDSDDDSDKDDSDDSSDDSDESDDDSSDDDNDSDDGGDDDDDSDDSDDDGSDSDDSGGDSDDDKGKDSAPPWANKFAAMAARIDAGESPLAWGGTPFVRSSARKEAVGGAEGSDSPVSDVNTPTPPEPGGGVSPSPSVPGMEGGIAESTKPRQMPEGGGGMDPSMTPGMGMDGIAPGGASQGFDPAMNGGDVQQGKDDLPSPTARLDKVAAIARHVKQYNPTLSDDQCQKVAGRVFDEYLSKHAEDMSPLLFGDRGGVQDGPATNKVKTWSPADFKPTKPGVPGQEGGGEDGEDGEDKGGGPHLPSIMPKIPMPGAGGAAGAGAGEAAAAGGMAGEAATAAELLPLLAL